MPAPILNAETATAYIIAQHDQDVSPCNVVETSEHDTIDGRSCVEVLFWYNGWQHTADVWVETRPDGTQHLYGEW